MTEILPPPSVPPGTTSVQRVVCQVCCREFKLPQVTAASKLPPSIITVETTSNSLNADLASANKRARNKNNICGACKKFYSRSKASNASIFTEKCTCPEVRVAPNPMTDRNPDGRARKLSSKHLCRACRARRCHAAMLDPKNAKDATGLDDDDDDDIATPTPGFISTQSQSSPDNNNNNSVSTPLPSSTPLPPPPSIGTAAEANGTTGSSNGNRINVRMIPCEICGVSSSGYHFGVISCEGCKGFFRRSISKKTPYKCKLQTKLGATVEDRSSRDHQMKCKKCRFDACLAAGMSLSAVQTGRHSMQRKIETSAYVKKLAAENRLLTTPVMRGNNKLGRLGKDGEVKLEAADVKLESQHDSNSSSSSSSESDGEDEQITVDDDDDDGFSPKSLSLSISQPGSVVNLSPSVVAAALGTPPSNRSFDSPADSGETKRLKFDSTVVSNVATTVMGEIGVADLISNPQQTAMVASTPIPVAPGSTVLAPFVSSQSGAIGNAPGDFSGQFGQCPMPCFSSPPSTSSDPVASTSSTHPYMYFTQPFQNGFSSSTPVAISNNNDMPSTSTAGQQSQPPIDLNQAPQFNFSIPIHIGMPTPYPVQALQMESVQTVAQRILDSSFYLNRISQIPETPLTFDMDPLAAWTDVMNSLFDRFVTSVSSFVRLLPGFRELCQADRVVLFTQAYFPILLAQLSLNYDMNLRTPNFFCQSSAEAREMLKFLLCGTGDLCERQMNDTGFTVATWKPNALEFSLFCGLLYFDPNVPELVEPEKVRQINEAYQMADETFNSQRDQQPSSSSLVVVAGSSNNNNSLRPSARFSSLVRYFKPLYQLLGFVMKSIENERPDFVNVHPLWSEMHKYLTRKIANSDLFDIDNKLSQLQQPKIQ